MKIRLEGILKECEQAAPRLAEVFDVVSISDPTPTAAEACWSASTSRFASAQSATSTRTTPPRRRGPRSTGPDGSCPHPDLADQHHQERPRSSAGGALLLHYPG